MTDNSQPSRIDRPVTGPADDPAAKVAFLSSPDAYAHRPAQVRLVETHMSWVFLTGGRVYKLKKPLKRAFLDFSTLEKRRHNCEVELRLNRRLAGDTYLGLVPLVRLADGRLRLGGEGDIIDWLIEMRQLPEQDMLDRRVREGRVTPQDVARIARHLAELYRGERPRTSDGFAYLEHLTAESRINREQLRRPELGLDSSATRSVLDRADALLAHWRPAIGARIAGGHVVEGHGDLRPEHVCLTTPPRIIDCLEFDRRMRLLDPYDEVNYLGLECEFLSAGWIRPLLMQTLEDLLGDAPDPRLVATYGAFRAILRARISIAHLDAPDEPTPDHWRRAARRYLGLAAEECLRAEG